MWDDCDGDLKMYRDEVRIMLLHELGHYLGLDEEQVAALGWRDQAPVSNSNTVVSCRQH
ncbi:MAG: metallopeptidase family protein [Verrucomicrobiaceae bacterium]|nr:metallopeptidase family protein [Verrucomicrobiaceae bacterium]